MPTFANQFKSEVSRLAKKEVRSETKTLKSASAQYRSEIAALKRRLIALEALVKKQGRSNAKGPAKDSEEESETSRRFRASGFSSLRKKLDLSASEMAQLLGVSAQSVYHWETGKSKPRASQLPAIAAVRKMGKKAVAAKLAESAG